uniref:Uncharacterized protein n=1 Tax=Oryza glumipatula TaxID=40148 RepID=A0A0E0BTW7_9ORYZ
MATNSTTRLSDSNFLLKINLIGNRTKMRKDVKCWNFEMIVDSDRTCFMDFVQSIKIPLYHGRMKLQLLLCPFHHQGQGVAQISPMKQLKEKRKGRAKARKRLSQKRLQKLSSCNLKLVQQ